MGPASKALLPMKLPLPISEAYLFKLQDTPLVVFVRMLAISNRTVQRRLDISSLTMEGCEGVMAMATKAAKARMAVGR